MATYKVRGSQSEGFFFGLYHEDGLRAARALHAALRHAERFARQGAGDGGWTFAVNSPRGTIMGRSKRFGSSEDLEVGIRRARGIGCGRSPARFVDESDAARGFAPLPEPVTVPIDNRLRVPERGPRAAVFPAAPNEPRAHGTLSAVGHSAHVVDLQPSVDEPPQGVGRGVRERIGG